MAASRYRRLVAHRISCELANALRAEARRWEPLDRWTVGVQAVRAADSVGANIAEAAGRYRFGDRVRFLHIARGSAFEVEHWIVCAIERDLLPAEFELRSQEVIRVLSGLIQNQRPP